MSTSRFRAFVLATAIIAALVGLRLPASTAQVECDGKPATLVGTDEKDRMSGTSGDDVIVGMGDNDTIYGMEGHDTICGGDGNDTIYGDGGSADGQSDRLFGE